MARYVLRTVETQEAVKWDGDNLGEVSEFLREQGEPRWTELGETVHMAIEDGHLVVTRQVRLAPGTLIGPNGRRVRHPHGPDHYKPKEVTSDGT